MKGTTRPADSCPLRIRGNGAQGNGVTRTATCARRAARSRGGRCAWALAAALAGVPAGATGDDGEVTRIAGGTNYLGDVPTLVADRQGYFEHHGLRTELIYQGPGKRNLARLRAGDTDFALMALTPLVLDRLADTTPGAPDDPVVLASLVHSTQLNQVVALDGSGVEHPADLAGRRVGLVQGTNAEFVWWLFAHYHGLAPAAVERVDHRVDALPDALVAGDVDAAVLWEPWTTRLRQRVGGRLRAFAGSNAYTAKWVLVTRRETSEQRAAHCRAVLSAYRDAIAFIRREPERAQRMYAEHAEVAPEALGERWDEAIYDLNLDWSVIATLQQQFDWARDAGYAAAGAPPGMLSLLAPAPLRALLPGAVGIPRVVPPTEGKP